MPFEGPRGERVKKIISDGEGGRSEMVLVPGVEALR